MDNNMFQRLKDLVTQHQNIGVIVPPNPSLDEMGAGLGMFLALKQMGKNVAIVSPTPVTVGVSSLVGVDKVQQSFGGPQGGTGNDLVVSFPYREGEIEKVSYTVDNGKLNIVIKAGSQGLSFTQSDVEYRREGGTPAVGGLPSLLFLIGVADINSVSSVIGQNPQNTTIVNIDNKQNNTNYGDVAHVSTKFSSVSEEVADFLTLLEPQIELDVDSSQNLLSGILSATNDFQDGKASYLSFEMAGILMKKGAVRSVSGSVANPTTPPMQPNSYFPPQQNNPQVAPVAQPQSVQPVGNMPFPPIQPAQPAQQMPQQPVQQYQQPVAQPMNQFPPQQAPVAPQQSMQQLQPVQEPQAVMQPAQPQPGQQPPSDWLTPKVYKGSTVL